MATTKIPAFDISRATKALDAFLARTIKWALNALNDHEDRVTALEAGGGGAHPEVYATKAALKASLTLTDEALYGIEDGGFFQYDAESAAAADDSTVLVAAIGGRLIKVAYAAHAHAQADVTGLVDALSGKAPTSHTHAQADVTGLTAIATQVEGLVDIVEKPVLNWYAPGGGLPATPTLGDRYLSSAAGNGWFAKHIYECTAEEIADPPTPAVWADTTAVAGTLVLNLMGTGGVDAKELRYDGADWVVIGETPFTGATGGADGKIGAVPKPLIADVAKYLKADGTWADVVATVGDGVVTPPKVADTAGEGVFAIPLVVAKTVAPGITGNPDDTELYAVDTLPFPFVILGVHYVVGAGADAGREVQIRTAAAGAGTLKATIPAAATGNGFVPCTDGPPVVPGALVGLFLRRSHDAIGFSAVILCAKVSGA